MITTQYISAGIRVKLGKGVPESIAAQCRLGAGIYVSSQGLTNDIIYDIVHSWGARM